MLKLTSVWFNFSVWFVWLAQQSKYYSLGTNEWQPKKSISLFLKGTFTYPFVILWFMTLFGDMIFSVLGESKAQDLGLKAGS